MLPLQLQLQLHLLLLLVMLLLLLQLLQQLLQQLKLLLLLQLTELVLLLLQLMEIVLLLQLLLDGCRHLCGDARHGLAAITAVLWGLLPPLPPLLLFWAMAVTRVDMPASSCCISSWGTPAGMGTGGVLSWWPLLPVTAAGPGACKGVAAAAAAAATPSCMLLSSGRPSSLLIALSLFRRRITNC